MPSTPIIEHLLDLPWSERRDALEEFVVAEFKAILLMAGEEELPLDQSYFDLGLTSLTITDLRQRLEEILGCELDTALLFNKPTVETLLNHVTDDLLADIFGAPAGAGTAGAPVPGLPDELSRS